VKSKIQSLLELADSNEKSSVSFAERRFPNAKAAKKAFSDYKSRILDVKRWNESSTITGFALYDKNGKEIINQPIRKDLLLRLSMPGSGKFDWVKTTDIENTSEEFILVVRPTYDPTDEDANRAKISHFFAKESNNNFCLTYSENTVKFYIIGLNEMQNTSDTKNSLETVRNFITANVGYYLSIQKSQWDSFCQNFLDSYQSSNES
jgi:hypothetical protein